MGFDIAEVGCGVAKRLTHRPAAVRFFARHPEEKKNLPKKCFKKKLFTELKRLAYREVLRSIPQMQ
jgi:hypothetical protein